MKCFTPIRVAMAALVFALVSDVRAAESLSVLLQKGIYAEETEGNLDSAIKIYEQIAAEGAANRSLMAQAQFRLAVCFQKQGKKEQAIGALNGLLKEFPAETQLGQKSRELLAELGQDTANPPKIRKVFAPEGIPFRLSADGRFVAYHPKDNRRAISVCDLSTGSVFTSLKGDQVVRGLAISFDGRQIAYQADDGWIYVAAIDGSGARKVLKWDKIISILGWSPDPRKLVVLPWDTSPLHIKLLSVDTGELTEVAAMPSAMFFDGEVSSDGRYVTSRALEPGNGSGTISIIDVETLHAETWAEKGLVQVVGWSPKQARLFFTSLRSGTIDLWAIPLKDGKLAGEAELIRNNVGSAEFEAVTPEGNLLFWEEVGAANIVAADFDFRNGRMLEPPRRITARWAGRQTKPIWSADGKSMMVIAETSPRRFLRVSVATEEAREYSLADKFVWPISGYTWAELDGSLIVQSMTSGSDWGIFRYDLGTESTSPVIGDTDGSRTLQPEISADGHSIFYVQRRGGTSGQRWRDAQARIVRRDLHSGQEEVVHTLADGFNHWTSVMNVSPDARQVAIASWYPTEAPDKNWTATLDVIVPATNVRRSLATAKTQFTSIAWTPDSQRLVYAVVSPSERRTSPNHEIWSVLVESGAAVRLNYAAPNIADLAVHPDGRKLAFREGALRDRSELWIMEGFVAKKPHVAMSAGQRAP